MLLEFRSKNFKTFKDELIFSMTPAPKQKGLDYSILKEKIGNRVHKGLSSAVIYGPNAAGKTNIIGAMDVLKQIVLRGHIRNVETKSLINPASTHLEYIPNKDNIDKVPVDFGIKFVDSGYLIDYRLSLDLGRFLDDEDYNRKVLSEILYVDEKLIFSRDNAEIMFPNASEFIKKFVDGFDRDEARLAVKLAQKNLIREELFLMNGFKNLFSSSLVYIISDWFEENFKVYCRADSLQVRPSNSKKVTLYLSNVVNQAARAFGVNSNALGYMKNDDDSEHHKLVSLVGGHEGNKPINAEDFESFGTIRFVNMFPIVRNALLHGATLIIDEFDASLHPMALMSIVNAFHNDELNKKNAQLIFNTHNPIFLNSNLFRRDEIKFVERDEVTFCSNHYSLSDFGTSGKEGVRNGGDYMKNYFINQYGAIKDIDFTSVFENLWESRGEKIQDATEQEE